MNNKLIIALSILGLSGCVSNSADTATPAPTDMAGIYKAPFFGGSVTWSINPDGTGFACEERTDVTIQPKLSDLVVNGNTVYSIYEFQVTAFDGQNLSVSGITDLDFKKRESLPIACKALL